jgi:Tfp pilus assembly protein PilF
MHLEQGYNLDNNQPHINNMLAYYWATTGKDIIKAENFIAKALAKDKNNPYFLDTHALILYKQKKYDQAQAILEQLQTSHTATSLLHLAKVHYKLDNKKEAAMYMQQATSLKNNTHDQKKLHKLQLLLATND